jgi:hypothetical protein
MEVIMKRCIFFPVSFLLMLSIFFVAEGKGEKPVLSSVRWDSDIRIGERDSVNAVVLDVDYSNGNLFAVLKNTESGNEYWSVNISVDTGRTWTETGFMGPGIGDIDGAVLNDYFYFVYTIGSRALIRRFSTSDGSWDISYGTDTVFSTGTNIREIALVSEQDASSPTRLYCFAILNNNSLRFYNSNETVTSWGTTDLNITNADRGLDACYNEGYGSRYAWCSYIGTNDSVYIEGVGLFLSYNYGPLTDVLYPIDFFSITSIGAYRDTVMVLYPYHQSEFDYSVKSYTSYDGGNSWNYEESLFGENSAGFWCASAITARKGDGFGAVIMGTLYGLYRHRDYPAGAWSDGVNFTDYSLESRFKPAIERIATNSYGIIYVDHPTRAARFDISQWPQSGVEEKLQEENLLNVSPLLFSRQTSIEYTLGAKQHISLDVYNVLGSRIKTLVSGEVPAGIHSAVWDGIDDSGDPVASGVYLCVLKTNGKPSISKRILLIR